MNIKILLSCYPELHETFNIKNKNIYSTLLSFDKYCFVLAMFYYLFCDLILWILYFLIIIVIF